MTAANREALGLRRSADGWRYDSRDRPAHPFVSVVTVVYKDPLGLAQTIDSVGAQTGGDFEYLVLDGGSGEDTVNVVAARLTFIDLFVSAPDRGLYHAMNKAVSLARGQWVIFMNAGDRFDHDHVLDRFHPKEESDLAYGDAQWDDRPSEPWVAKPIEDLWRGMAFSHQALFTKRNVLMALPFREDMRIVADYDFLVRCAAAGKRFERLGFTICRLKPGGRSDVSPYRRTFERLPIALKAFPDKPVLSHYFRILIAFVRRDLGRQWRHLRRAAD